MDIAVYCGLVPFVDCANGLEDQLDDPGCSSSPWVPGTDFTVTRWNVAQFGAADVCALRQFEVILYPTFEGGAGVTGSAIIPDALQEVQNDARRAVLLGFDIDDTHHVSNPAAAELLRGLLDFLGDDGPSTTDSSCAGAGDQAPAILALPDMRKDTTFFVRYSYLVWDQMRAASSTSVPLNTLFGWDDITIVDPAPLSPALTDVPPDACSPAARSLCTLDAFNQSTHHVWAGAPFFYYERDGFKPFLTASAGTGICYSPFVLGTAPSGNIAGLYLDRRGNRPPRFTSICPSAPDECTGPDVGRVTGELFRVGYEDPEGDPLEFVNLVGNTTHGVICLDDPANQEIIVRTNLGSSIPMGVDYTVLIRIRDVHGEEAELVVCRKTMDTINPSAAGCVAGATVTKTVNPGTGCKVKAAASDYLALHGSPWTDCSSVQTLATWPATHGFVVGTYPLTLVGTDTSGNSSTCGFTLIVEPATAVIDCSPVLALVSGDEYLVQWNGVQSCGGECCVLLLNGHAVEGGETVRLVHSFEERREVVGGVQVFFTRRACLSVQCASGTASCPEDSCLDVPGKVRGQFVFFRVDKDGGENSTTVAVTVSNPNAVAVQGEMVFRSLSGSVIRVRPTPTSPHADALPVVIPANGSILFPPPPYLAKQLLNAVDVSSALAWIGYVEVNTFGDAATGAPVTQGLLSRLNQVDTSSLNNRDGYSLLSQAEASNELWGDSFLSLRDGTSGNFNYREFLVVRNVDDEPVNVEFFFYRPDGLGLELFQVPPLTPGTGRYPPGSGFVQIPVGGTYTFNTAALQDTMGIVMGSVRLLAHTDSGHGEASIMGASVTFAQQGTNPNDRQVGELPYRGTPMFGTDLRGSSRR